MVYFCEDSFPANWTKKKVEKIKKEKKRAPKTWLLQWSGLKIVGGEDL
jgi:hypothetical protein